MDLPADIDIKDLFGLVFIDGIKLQTSISAEFNRLVQFPTGTNYLWLNSKLRNGERWLQSHLVLFPQFPTQWPCRLLRVHSRQSLSYCLLTLRRLARSSPNMNLQFQHTHCLLCEIHLHFLHEAYCVKQPYNQIIQSFIVLIHTQKIAPEKKITISSPSEKKKYFIRN